MGDRARGTPIPTGDPFRALLIQSTNMIWAKSNSRSGVESALRVLACRALTVLVATVVGQRAAVVARRVELGPPGNPEVLDPRNVRKQARRLLDVDAVLALMPCN